MPPGTVALLSCSDAGNLAFRLAVCVHARRVGAWEHVKESSGCARRRHDELISWVNWTGRHVHRDGGLNVGATRVDGLSGEAVLSRVMLRARGKE